MPRDYVEQVAGVIIEQLRDGTAPWIMPWQPGERFLPYNPTTGNAYHGMNAVWLLSRAEFHGYEDVRWMTYRQAQEAGAQVRKGEKGTVIQFWKWQGLESVRDVDGNAVLDEAGNPVRQMVRYQRPRVWSAVVFNAAQIDGLPPAPQRATIAEWERHGRAETILARSGVTIRHVPADRAFYRLSDDTITLPVQDQFPSADRYYATALHEVGHATGHPTRLNREELGHPFGSEAYAREELRAEIASLMLGEQLGIGHDPRQHVAYVASWIRVLENDPREIFQAAADAEKITGLVLSFEQERARAADHDLEQQGGQEITERAADVRPPVMIEERHPSMATTDDRIYLAVPFAEKDAAKQLGARWDRQAKAWYVPAGVDLEAFTAWLPAKGSVHVAVEADPVAEFTEALLACGLRPDGQVQMDGEMHRVPVEGDKGRSRSGAYVGHLDGRPAGFIQNFKTGVKTTWRAAARVLELSAEDRARMAAETAQKRHERARERERQYERVAQEVETIWAAAEPASEHSYLSEKGVPSHGLRQGAEGQTITIHDRDGQPCEVSVAGRLLIPVADVDGRIMSLQFIDPSGAKMFMPNGRVEGGHFVIGHATKPGPVLIAEGYATAATLHDLTGMLAVVAFNAGNLLPVAQAWRQTHPDRPIYVAGDNDHRREAEGKPNVGREKAEEAAAAVGGFALLPVFVEEDKGTDWNDLALSQGRDMARRQFLNGLEAAEREQMARASGASHGIGKSIASQELTSRDQVPDTRLER